MWLCIVRYVRLDLLAEKSFMLTVLVRDTVHVHLTKTDKVSMECRYHRLAYTKLQLLPQPSSLWRLLCAVPSWACDTPRHRTALCCILLPHRTARHCTALHGTARHCMARHGTARHCTALHGTARHCTALQAAELEASRVGELLTPPSTADVRKSLGPSITTRFDVCIAKLLPKQSRT